MARSSPASKNPLEICWWLDPAVWGRGIATEAATAIRDEAFGRLSAKRIVPRLQPRNVASERVTARLGMRFHGDAVGRTGKPVRVYILERRDWQAHLRALAGGKPSDSEQMRRTVGGSSQTAPMYGAQVRRQALDLIGSGSSLRSVSKATGISRATLREWRDDDPARAPAPRTVCPRCAEDPVLPESPTEYAYLLGLYLGDGCISVGGDPAKRVWKLRIFCADAWPGLVQECVHAMQAVRPTSKVMLQQKPGCQEVTSYSKHWPCLLPQHAPGKKHLRKIELQPWQETIVAEFPGDFVRGLLHSDGYRGLNRVRRVLPSGEHWYEYPRYLFSNKSKDILELCGAALDRLEVEWRYSRPDVISVAKRRAVARLDAHVGPKY